MPLTKHPGNVQNVPNNFQKIPPHLHYININPKVNHHPINPNLKTTPLSSGSQLHIERLISNVICSTVLPFRMVDNPHFRNLIRFLQPNAKTFPRGTITNRIREQFQTMKNDNISYFKTNPFKISLTTDGWTDRLQPQFMSLTAYVVSQELCQK